MSGFKKFSDDFLKSNGVDAHEVKKEFGCKKLSSYDIYNGDTVTIREKSGKLFADTGMSNDQFLKNFGSNKENRYGY